MYDLEIVLAVSNNGKYSTRLNEFKKHGLTCINNKKVMLSILVGTETIEDIDKGWPKGIDVRIISSLFDHCAAKMNDYYANQDQVDAKWIMRVDDDSITKVSQLIDVLKRFDPDDVLYFSTPMIQGDTSVEIGLLHEFNSVYKNDPLWHEVECCILSRACFNRIKSNKFTLDILKKRAKIESGYTDICLAACARECGVLPTLFYFITHEPDVRKFLNEVVLHIHYVAVDVNNKEYIIAKNDRQNCKLINKKIIITNDNKNVGYVIINSNGTLSSNLRDFDFWVFEDSNINIFSEARYILKDGTYIKYIDCELQLSICCETLHIFSKKLEEHTVASFEKLILG